MPAQTEPRSGLFYGWTLGETPWNEGMDANLLHIGRFGLHLSVIDRDLTAPPSEPVAGDTYIVGAGATGDWTGKDDQVALYDGAAWVFGEPRTGWRAHIEDELTLCIYRGGAWDVLVPAAVDPMTVFTSPLTVLDRDLTEPPLGPSAGDTYIVGTSAIGDWAGRDGDLARWDGEQWIFAAADVGWLAYIEDEEVLSVYKATGWSAGVSI